MRGINKFIDNPKGRTDMLLIRVISYHSNSILSSAVNKEGKSLFQLNHTFNRLFSFLYGLQDV